MRTVYPVVPPKVEYALTELWRSIHPILQGMYDWVEDYLRGQGIKVNRSMTAPRA